MLKTLDRFILKSFIPPFIATFLVAMFILVMQFVWKYVDDFAGKGIDGIVLAEFFMYLTAGMVPLALPLGIMLASIMVFGNLSERYEIAAMKASGISIQRIMRPLIILVALISIIAFLYANYVLPIANLKSYTLLYSITEQKPAINLKEGIFYNGIENMSIRVGRKDKNNTDLYDLIIYNHTNHKGTDRIIYANQGMISTADSGRFLKLTLRNGNSYEEIHDDAKPNDTKPFVRNKFSLQELLVDLSAFKLKKGDENDFKNNSEMLNIKQLDNELDSSKFEVARMKKIVISQINATFNYNADTNLNEYEPYKLATWYKKLNKQEKIQAIDIALSISRSNKSNADFLSNSFLNLDNNAIRLKIAWHKKFTLSLACLILFFIGAPLGTIIKKGGLGMPMVVSVMFFVVFHVLSVVGEKTAKEGGMTVFMGMWLATFILLPIGAFLTYKATVDSTLFDWDTYKNQFKKMISFFKVKLINTN